MAKGYWQVPVAQKDQPKTAFISPEGLFEFTTMPFGLRGAPATFQRLMDKLLRGTESFTGVYLDDILIYSQTWQEYLSHVRVVLKRLEQAGLTLKSSKCVFGTVECEYLGHKIGKGGVSPLESKILAIQNIAKPQTKKEVRTFLGMTGYYRCYIRDYATIAAPLTDLTKKNQPDRIKWTLEAESALNTHENALSSSLL